ncbi:Hemocytin like protein [Argiope bruennichi]|uniref:Hemocytin like protein n=1 Tax=Argiope bruennichi TaxID=94029 RepID=A0A8T0G5H0_ARGBR|nr:Hemocytin like protein [Argiope bruennichi]
MKTTVISLLGRCWVICLLVHASDALHKGSRSVKGGSTSSTHTRRFQTQSEPQVVRSHYSESQAYSEPQVSRSHYSGYSGSTSISNRQCQRPASPNYGQVSCRITNDKYSCTVSCMPGYTYPDGSDSLEIECSKETGEWLPSAKFEDCIGGSGPASSAYSQGGYSRTFSRTNTYGGGSYGGGSYGGGGGQGKGCEMPKNPAHGYHSCSMSNGQWGKSGKKVKNQDWDEELLPDVANEESLKSGVQKGVFLRKFQISKTSVSVYAFRCQDECLFKLPRLLRQRASNSNVITQTAQLKNGLEILWDLGQTIQVFAPVELFASLRALCGTFTKSQQDEFLTPEGDVETSAGAFTQKWRVEDSCREVEESLETEGEEKACDLYPERRDLAADVCNIIKGPEFKDCHNLLDYGRYYADCMEDVCSCEDDPVTCTCLSLANFAYACARKGQPLSWRQAVPTCGIACPPGQVYQSCADPCSYSCEEIANTPSKCPESCVEGCVCPPGQTLNEHGLCIPVSSCSCVHSRGQGLCGKPSGPTNGFHSCSMSNGQWSCQGSCYPGYEFPDGTRQTMFTCHDRNGIWSPKKDFDDCILLCHPPCENGGRCAVHNQCQCPSTHRGNRCQYSIQLCDIKRLTTENLYTDCRHLSEYTECRVSCPAGMTFNPPTSPLYRCTVDGLWNPPTAPTCVMDSLCEQPPSPMNGRSECQGSSEIMLCRATCDPGYVFEDGFEELSIQCVRRTGVWSPTVGFPDCHPICSPECLHGGRCIGHNSCLCPKEYRGSRCEYPLSNCDGHERFASVGYKCRITDKETVCNVSCSSTGMTLQPPEPITYTCSLDGTWHPDLKPICVSDYSRLIDARTSQHGSYEGYGYEQGGGWQQSRSSLSQQTSGQRLNLGGYEEFGQQQIGHEFGGQQQMEHEFGEFGGQQQIGHEFFGGQQKNGADLVDSNKSGKKNLKVLEKNSGRVDLPKGIESGVKTEIEDDKFRLTDADSQEIIKTIGDNTEVSSDLNEFSSKRKVSNYRGICSAWGFYHYRTFDGSVYTFPSSCWYVLAANTENNFAISLKSVCTHQQCYRIVAIQHANYRYLISYTDGIIRNQEQLSIPVQDENLVVEYISRYLVIKTQFGYTIWINDENSVLISAEPYVQNQTMGMCGNFDGIPNPLFVTKDGTETPDIFAFTSSWKFNEIEGDCVEEVELKQPCNSENREKRMEASIANLACAAFYDDQFKKCGEVLDVEEYYLLCQMDCCSMSSVEDCQCASLGEFVLECSRAGVDMSEGWRQPGLCPLVCTNGTEYRECGPACPPTCADQQPVCNSLKCVDGCHCPEGTVLEKNQCVLIDSCPCHYEKQHYASGETIQQDCNACVCQGGNWKCTESICPATCSVSGPHILTFDGFAYDFQGKCSHYLVDSDDFNIAVDYGTDCRELHTINGVCVKSITIHTPEEAIVKLKPSMEVIVNGREMTSLPITAPGIYIGQSTSTFMRVLLAHQARLYQSCADPCSYSCAEIANTPSKCPESLCRGCVCPPGQTLNEHGLCIPVSSCSCVHSGHYYPPEFLQRRGKEMCECSQGHWDCHEASAADIILTPPPNIAPECNSAAHQVPTDCVSDCPLTCANYHHHQPCTVAVCSPGCNVCEGGSWNCESNICPGLCNAWGDAHFETFDGKLYDFDGTCEYVLVKARVSDKEFFSVTFQNVPCGMGSKATCGKTVSVTLGDSSLLLTRLHPLPSLPENSRLKATQVGMFTLVESDIGISVQWDRNTRVYVTAQPIWKNKLQGLCGDFNGDASDDFRAPSGGMPFVLAKNFADSWRLHKFCPKAKQPNDACDKNPDRRNWARHKCGVLKTDLFKPCHYQVEVEDYYKRSVLCEFKTVKRLRVKYRVVIIKAPL